MIYVTGDAHGSFQRFGSKHFPEQKEMSRDDYLIICGDFGGLWKESAEQTYWLDWLAKKQFTVLFVDGNHENFDMIYALPKKEWHGGTVHVVRDNIFHLMRGQLYEIDGHTFFTMGGAASHDIEDGILDPDAPDYRAAYKEARDQGLRVRTKGVSWWPQELPSQEEYETALKTLERADWKVDYVLSHCAPTSVQTMVSNGYKSDALTDFFEDISKRLQFELWVFGHYHNNRTIIAGKKYQLLWTRVMRLI